MAVSKLATQLKTAKPLNGGKRLLVDIILDKLTPVEKREVLAALHDPDRVSSAMLADILSENGHVITRGSVALWRKRNPSPK